LILSEIMLKKLLILKKFGFNDNSPTVIQTLKNTVKKDSAEKYRTKCFQNDEDRLKAYKAVF
jgi:hypothetical protein